MLRMFQGDSYGVALWRSANGTPDTTFNTVGTNHTSLVAGSDGAFGSAIQPTGELIAAGYANNGTDDDFAISRYLGNGTFDTSFNTTGKLISGIGSGNDRAEDVVVQTDGKIVAAGYSWNGSDYDFEVIRLLANGTFDTSFNATGKQQIAIGPGLDQAFAVALQSDGRIVVVGNSHNGANTDVAVVRLNTNGSLDTSFNSTGIATFNIAAGDDGSDVTIQADGKIVIVGDHSNANNFLVMRLTTAGALDTSFNGTGKFLPPAPSNRGNGIALQAGGSIVVVGHSSTGTFVGRVTTAGAWDTTFNATGYVVDVLGSPNAVFEDVAIQPDGRIVAVGQSCCYQARAARFNTDGTLDSSFGTAGISGILGSFGTNSYGRSLVLAGDGMIDMVGSADADFGVARFGSTTVSDYVGGSATWSLGANTFGACLRAVSGAGVASSWTTSATCPASDGAYWNAIPTTSVPAGAKVAYSTTAGTINATASIRFGFRASTSQPPGQYQAPIVLEVAAPNV